MQDRINELIEHGQLPTERRVALSQLIEDSGQYVSQEGTQWDFKREWPFSLSDDYFGAIARLICAFSNSFGGMIIFGVHDEKRTAGHNKVTPNLDRFLQALNNLLTGEPSVSLRRYDQGTPDAVDVLLVKPISTASPPLQFKRRLGNYGEGTIWVRQHHEVLAAEPKHVPMLYCRIDPRDAQDDIDFGVSGFLPPSPSTISTFVGRLSTIDKIFAWIKYSDEPRTFLYGKGGSGKTTIAYQVAKVLSLYGKSVYLYGKESIDNIIFVSAKQKMLETLTGREAKFVGLDFTDERSLYEAILTLGNWTVKSLSELTLVQLREEMGQFFDLTANLIVVDDVDTLTTQGLDAGFDFVYGLLWRAKKKSKILYTLRNAPTQSLANAIEVPGLDIGGEYETFVDVCARQFNVPPPSPTIKSGRLSEISERRPLVVEAIIAMRRTCGDYEQATRLFEEGPGEDIRGYVFSREWGVLAPNNFSRSILAIMSLYGEPLTFGDLLNLSRFDEGRVRDGLSEVREMFMKINDAGSETTYELGALTKAFVSEQAKKLERYENLKERVKQYRKSMYPENPALTRIKIRTEGLIELGRRSDPLHLKEALTLVNNPSHPAKIAEDPRFVALQGYVAAMQAPPNLEDARRLFANAIAMKHEPDIEQLRAWYFVEKESGVGFGQCLKIATLISSGKRYNESEKLEFIGRRAALQFHKANDLAFVEPDEALKLYKEVIRSHLHLYRKFVESDGLVGRRAEEYARNSAYRLFDYLLLTNKSFEYFALAVTEILSFKDVLCDPIELPLVRGFEIVEKTRFSKGEAYRGKNRLEHVRKILPSSQWEDDQGRRRVQEILVRTIGVVDGRRQEGG